MSEVFPQGTSEPEGYKFHVHLKGAGAAAPTLFNTGNNYTVSRTSAGVYKIIFNEDPGPTYQGVSGFAFGDVTASVVAGWSFVTTGFTARSGSTAAFYSFSVFNASQVATDLATTSRLTFAIAFKQAPAAE